jgi:hypothetical protein
MGVEPAQRRLQLRLTWMPAAERLWRLESACVPGSNRPLC